MPIRFDPAAWCAAMRQRGLLPYLSEQDGLSVWRGTKPETRRLALDDASIDQELNLFHAIRIPENKAALIRHLTSSAVL